MTDSDAAPARVDEGPVRMEWKTSIVKFVRSVAKDSFSLILVTCSLVMFARAGTQVYDTFARGVDTKESPLAAWLSTNDSVCVSAAQTPVPVFTLIEKLLAASADAAHDGTPESAVLYIRLITAKIALGIASGRIAPSPCEGAHILQVLDNKTLAWMHKVFLIDGETATTALDSAPGEMLSMKP